MTRIEIDSFGPIRRADIELGDLTILVGPQASGKSLFMQLFKAIQDAGAIRRDLRDYGFEWSTVADYCSIYFGGGMDRVWQRNTRVKRDGELVPSKAIVKPESREPSPESVILIPAQRVLVLQDGWPKPFIAYSTGDPYCIRRFSESLRLQMSYGFGRGESIFPEPNPLKPALQKLIAESIYVGGTLRLETEGMRKRVVLQPPGSDTALPYSAWSAGQREFTPLLMGLYPLMPYYTSSLTLPTRIVVIEEPEMGLHPQAIVSFGLLVLELLHQGYRVILSTHSPVILDLVWALREMSSLRKSTATSALGKMFHLGRMTKPIREVLHSALEKEYRTYYFRRTGDGVSTEDISSLDPGDENESVSGWGGLSGFSGRIATIVGEAMRAG